MTSAAPTPGGTREGQTFAGGSRLATYASFVKLPHTVFALPFALVGVIIASYRHAVTWSMLGWVVLAFTAARFAAMGLKVSGRDGTPVTPMMGSYGIGVSRLVGAIIEASHDDAGIIWPEAVAPWQVGLVTMRQDDESTVVAAENLYEQLREANVEILYDDRDERGGVKLGSMDLIGLPWQVVVGPRGIAAGTVELKRRSTGERQDLSIESALARLTA